MPEFPELREPRPLAGSPWIVDAIGDASRELGTGASELPGPCGLGVVGGVRRRDAERLAVRPHDGDCRSQLDPDAATLVNKSAFGGNSSATSSAVNLGRRRRVSSPMARDLPLASRTVLRTEKTFLPHKVDSGNSRGGQDANWIMAASSFCATEKLALFRPSPRVARDSRFTGIGVGKRCGEGQRS
jgi:hypothetical protein